MRTREWHDEEREPGQPGSGDPDSDNLAALNSEAAGLLAAGDAAIERALSRNSAAFLAANRQHGGQ